ncbi:uncharacterized protein [Haliotis cracherodii]|uniref:uncharacterized protein n=1 Tax=Haliotis cracherodii TaxID=6455 RepID=UPI0039E77DFC
MDETSPLLNVNRDGRSDNGDHIAWAVTDSISFFFSCAIVGLLLCFPIALIRGDLIMIRHIDPSPISPKCFPHISDSDLNIFHTKVVKEKARLLYVNITMPEAQKDTHPLHDIYLPNWWMWVSSEASEVSTFLSWQEDYAIWSFGILDFYTSRVAQFPLHVPESCNITLQSSAVMDMVAETLNNMTVKALSYLKHDYNGSRWCNRFKMYRETKMIRNFRYFVHDLGSDCYKLNHDGTTYKGSINPETTWTNISFAMSYLALLFSPLWFVYLIHYISNRSPVPWLRWGGLPSDGLLDESYIYLGLKSPTTFSSIFYDALQSMCEKCRCLRVCFTSRPAHLLKLFLLLAMSPIIIYIKVIIYKTNRDHHFLLDRQIKYNIPLGFSSMLFSFEEKSDNFLTFTYGPCVFLLIYHILGLIFIVIKTMFVIDFDNRHIGKMPLSSLHLSHMDSIRSQTSNRALNVIAENSTHRCLYLSFLNTVWTEDCEQGKCIGILKFPFSFVFHVFPFLFTSHLIMKGYMQAISKSLHRHTVLLCFVCLLLGTLYFCLIFCFTTIFLASFEFLTFIITFCYIALVTYPVESAGYFLFAISSLSFIARCLRDVAQTYHNLLSLTIQAWKEMNMEDMVLKRNRGQDVDTPPPVYPIYANGVYGIPKKLYEEIVYKYSPKPQMIAKAFCKMVFGTCALGWTISLIFKMHSDIQPLLNTLSAVVIVSIPDLLSILIRDSTVPNRDFIYKSQLKQTIRNFRE